MTNQEAIKILFKHREHWNRLLKDGICEEKEGKDIVKAIDTAVVALDYHPIGRWIEDGEGFLYPYKCSKCGSYHDKLYNYCPSCGEKKDLSEWEV